MKNLNKTKIIMIAIIAALFAIIYFGANHYRNKIDNLKDEVQNVENIAKALVDSIDYFKDENGNLIAQKRTLQASIKDLEKLNVDLNTKQRELLNKIEKLQKKYNLLSSTFIDTETKLNKLEDSFGKIDTLKNSVTFTDSTKNVQYNILVSNVLPYKLEKPKLSFKEFNIKNRISVDFVWGKKKEGYPVSVMVSSDNDFTEITDINSYVIPNLKPVEKKGFFNKIGKWFKNKADLLIGIGIGFGIGGVVMGGG